MKSTSKNPARNGTKRLSKTHRGSSEASRKDSPATARRASTAPRERDPRLPAVGATITREWHGKTLKVKCVEDGFLLDGTTYRSLSAAAAAASGYASVNGFLFFGLVPRAARPAAPSKSRGHAGADERIGGESNDIATPAGQRAALAAARLTGRRGAKPAGAAPDTAKPEAK